MLPLVHVVGVEVVGDHRLHLSFEDGEEGELDFSGFRWEGVFAALADPVRFAEVKLDERAGTIVWPNEVDIAPETLHHWVVSDGTPV